MVNSTFGNNLLWNTNVKMTPARWLSFGLGLIVFNVLVPSTQTVWLCYAEPDINRDAGMVSFIGFTTVRCRYIAVISPTSQQTHNVINTQLLLRFDVIITCLLRWMFEGYTHNRFWLIFNLAHGSVIWNIVLHWTVLYTYNGAILYLHSEIKYNEMHKFDTYRWHQSIWCPSLEQVTNNDQHCPLYRRGGNKLTRGSLHLQWIFHNDVIKWKHFPRYWSLYCILSFLC